MKEIVIISGKGGTGKTSLTASLSYLAGKEAVIADCDVDAADMHLLTGPDFAIQEDFFSGELAVIDYDKCTGCNKCYEVCRFSAIIKDEDAYSVDRINCEGCGYCSRVCPEGAISMVEQNVGNLYVSGTRFGMPMVHAKLGIGAENSGKLVAKVKTEARELASQRMTDYVIVDGSPGIGCPVVSSLSGADYVLLVTEPTVSGIHDLRRVYELVKKFGIEAGCIINKSDLNREMSAEIESFAKEEDIDILGVIPYDKAFTDSLINGLTVMEGAESEPAKLIAGIWQRIKDKLNKEK